MFIYLKNPCSKEQGFLVRMLVTVFTVVVGLKKAESKPELGQALPVVRMKGCIRCCVYPA